MRRPSTTTPLQALVLWNDEQFVEAARVLAQRILTEQSDERARLDALFESCTGRPPDADDRQLLATALQNFTARYADSPADATALLQVGEASLVDGVPEGELAAWTLLASAVLSLHETLTQD